MTQTSGTNGAAANYRINCRRNTSFLGMSNSERFHAIPLVRKAICFMVLRVLIVEDELILALDMEDLLTGAGHDVIGIAADMHQAIAMAERERPDLAIMDMNLARGTNGLDTARVLRERFDVPSLFVSGNLDPKTRAMAAQYRPVGFVPKPISEAAVLEVIATVV